MNLQKQLDEINNLLLDINHELDEMLSDRMSFEDWLDSRGAVPVHDDNGNLHFMDGKLYRRSQLESMYLSET